jgi:hypothetical protein
MSILRQVIEDDAISENLEALTDKTDKRASVSSVSEWSEVFKNNSRMLRLIRFRQSWTQYESRGCVKQGLFRTTTHRAPNANTAALSPYSRESRPWLKKWN